MEIGQAGDRAAVRGETWTVAQRTTYPDCTAVRLSAERDGRTATLLSPFDRIRPLTPTHRPLILRSRRWRDELRRLQLAAFPYGSLRQCAAGLDLLPYQLEPALAMLRHGHLRILIADAVGLGKTVQAGFILSELASRHDDFRGLAIVPAGLREQWAEELSMRFGVGATIADAAWLRRAAQGLPGDVNPWSLPGTWIASSDFVKRPEALHPLEQVRWDLVIVDEAHGAAAGTDRRAAIDAIARRSRRVILLTATPRAGDALQYAALTAIGANPGGPPPLVFRRASADGSGRRSRLWRVRPSPAESRMHRLLEAYTALICRHSLPPADSGGRLAAIVLRKRALSSARSLAISLRRRHALLRGSEAAPQQPALPWDDEEERGDCEPDEVLGKGGLVDGEAESAALEEIARAADAASGDDRKLRTLVRFLHRIREPAIVFTEYRDTLERLSVALQRTGIGAAMLHGGLTTAERRAAVEAFARGGAVLLATDAASEGLNLHHRCRTVVHYELPWTPARLEQRAGRVDRLGQRRRVHEIALVAADTAEDLVLAPLARRIAAERAAADSSIEGIAESQVAAAILDGTPIEPPPATPARVPCPPRGLAAEARAEAARLSERRGIAAAHAPSAPPAGIPIARLRHPSACAHAWFLFEIRLVDGTGAIVASEIRVADAGISVRVPRRRADLRALASALISESGARLLALRERWRQDALQRAAPAHAATLAALVERERAVGSTAGSAARELVQAGLFDRRALKHADALRSHRANLAFDTLGRVRNLEAAGRITPLDYLRGVLLVPGSS